MRTRKIRKNIASERQTIADVYLLLLSIPVAFYIQQSGLVHTFTTGVSHPEILGSLVAGLFFTSLFTTAPAIIILGELAQEHSILAVALWGGLGAAVGDYIIFRFMRDRFGEDIEYMLGRVRAAGVLHALRHVRYRWIATIVGGLIIASPLPDELGLALLGITRVSLLVLLPLTFVLNAGGIYVIGEVARALQF